MIMIRDAAHLDRN